MIKILNNWKEFFKDKQKALLFLIFILFFPVPFYIIIVAGILPAGVFYCGLFLLLIKIISHPLEKNIIFTLLALLSDTIFIVLISYLFRFLINKTAKIVTILTDKKTLQWLLVTTICTVLILISLNFTYAIADAGGGGESFTLYELLCTKFKKLRGNLP